MAMPFNVIFTEGERSKDVTACFVTEHLQNALAIQLIENMPLQLTFSGDQGKLYADFLTERVKGVMQDAGGPYVVSRSAPYVLYAYGHSQQYPLIAGDYIVVIVTVEATYYAKLHVAPKRMSVQQFEAMRETLINRVGELALIRTTKIATTPTNEWLTLLYEVAQHPLTAVEKGYVTSSRGGRKDGKVKRLQRQKPYRSTQLIQTTRITYDTPENCLVKHWLQQYTIQQPNEKVTQAIYHFLRLPWVQQVNAPSDAFIPRTFFSAGRYGALYAALVQQTRIKTHTAQLQFRRTDELYELWGFITLASLTASLGYTMVEEVKTKEALTYTFKKDKLTIYMVYDEVITRDPAKSTTKTPLYTLQNNRPDCRIDLWREGRYGGSLVIDFKYRHRDAIWQEEILADVTKAVPSTMLQLEAYGRNFRTAIQEVTDAHIALQPIHEVWALYPLTWEKPEDNEKNAFNIRLMHLSPNTSAAHIAEQLEAIYQRATLG